MKRCTKCLLPISYPRIEFDEEGVCNHCRAFRHKTPLGEHGLLQKIKSKSGPTYDCLLGISGGRDSCYVAYLAKRRLGLRALAVCYDFPFMVDLARENIRRVCSNLDLELVVVSSRNNLEYDLIRDHLISLAPTRTTWGQCLFCHHGIDAILRREAIQREIPFVLSGVTSNELWDPGKRSGFLLKRLRKMSLGDLAAFSFRQSRCAALLLDQRRQFRSRLAKGTEGPETVRVFDYVPWDHREIEKVLAEETGWKKPEGPTAWRYDCILEPMLDYTYKREFGVSTVGIYLSGLIRQGIMSREEALEAMEASESDEFLREKAKQVFRFLKIPEPVQRKFLDAAP